MSGKSFLMRSFIICTAGHLAWMGKVRSAFKILVGKPQERDSLGNLGIGRRIILKQI
jgi:hypothetical protein